MGLSIEQIYFFKDIYDEVVSSINNNTELDIKKTVQQLTSLISSEKFIPWLFYNMATATGFIDIVIMYEMKEKFLSLKIIFPLFEELKNNKKCALVLDKLFKLLNSSKEKKENQFIEYILNLANQYTEKYKDSIEKFKQSEECKKALEEINSFAEVKGNKVKELYDIYKLIFFAIYYEDLANDLDGQLKKAKSNGNDDIDFKQLTKDFDDEDINLIIKNLMQIKSLNYTKDIYQVLLFIFNIKKIEKEISQREELNNKFFKDIKDKLDLIYIFKIHNSICWIIYEKVLPKSNDNYSKYICKGNMTDEEKLYFDIFDKIDDISINNEVYGIKILLLQSLFTKNKIVLIKIDIEHLKKSNITLEQIDKNIKNIQSKLPSQYKNLNKYLLIDNNIINLNNSYDKFLNEIKKRNKNENEQNEINIRNSNDKINININNNDIIDINEVKELLNKEKNNNNLLSEKIKKLENELYLEKDKNILLEKNIINLKQELENEIQKNNNLIKNLEGKKGLENVSLKSKLDNNVNSNNINNNELIQSIIKKDKEIEELKLKLSRFPFMLEEGENLLSIIIKSKDDTMNTPIICKNTDKFYKIEELLCEKYSKYKDTENIFYLNGNKIKKNKNLTQNKIKNGDIIIFDALEEEE